MVQRLNDSGRSCVYSSLLSGSIGWQRMPNCGANTMKQFCKCSQSAMIWQFAKPALSSGYCHENDVQWHWRINKKDSANRMDMHSWKGCRASKNSFVTGLIEPFQRGELTLMKAGMLNKLSAHISSWRGLTLPSDSHHYRQNLLVHGWLASKKSTGYCWLVWCSKQLRIQPCLMQPRTNVDPNP